MGGVSRNSPAKEDKEILSHVLHSTVGLVKNYRITYSDDSTFDYSVTDGANGLSGTTQRIKFLEADDFSGGIYTVLNKDLQDYDMLIVNSNSNSIILFPNTLIGSIKILNRLSKVTMLFGASFDVNASSNILSSDYTAASVLINSNNTVDLLIHGSTSSKKAFATVSSDVNILVSSNSPIAVLSTSINLATSSKLKIEGVIYGEHNFIGGFACYVDGNAIGTVEQGATTAIHPDCFAGFYNRSHVTRPSAMESFPFSITTDVEYPEGNHLVEIGLSTSYGTTIGTSRVNYRIDSHPHNLKSRSTLNIQQL